MDRHPAVAGMFYPDSPSELRQALQQMMPGDKRARSAFGVVMPHAGYLYSGSIAGQVLDQVLVPDRVFLLGPNHHGIGASAALYGRGRWHTPLGDVPVNTTLAQKLLDACPLLVEDEYAHRQEHSLEVQVPFLLQANPQVEIVPICLGHGRLEDWTCLGRAIAEVIRKEEEPILIVASTDMSHYVHEQRARELDRKAIDQILALDAQGLYDTVRHHRISMCGIVPVTVLLAAAESMGQLKARLVHYGTSGDVTGDRQQVVGYAGMVIA